MVVFTGEKKIWLVKSHELQQAKLQAQIFG